MYFRRCSRFAYPSSFCGINACLLFVFSTIIHYFSFINNKLYFTFIAIVSILALLSLIFAILTLSDLWKYGYKGGLRALRAIIYSVAVFLPIIFGYYEFFIKTPRNDVTTDINNPPHILLSKEATAVQPASAMPNRYNIAMPAMLDNIKMLAKQENWLVVEELNDLKHSKNYYLQLKQKTWKGGFVSDLIVRLHQEEGNSIFVDGRAYTEGLKSDAGLADKFLAQFMEHLEEIIIMGNAN